MAPFRARVSAIVSVSVLALAANVAGCSDEATPEGSGGMSGSGATAGAAGSAAGTAGASGSAGAATGGTAGSATGGSAGTGGASGAAGSGAGAGGTAGMSGAGNGGAGAAGAAGSSGSAGSAGAGNGGQGGAGGAGAGGLGGAGAAGAGAGGMSGAGGVAGTAGSGGSGEFTLSSPAFDSLEGCGPGDDAEACDVFPIDNTRFGEDVSPELNWTNVPEGTQSFVMVFQDLSNGMAHWVMWNIPGELTSLPAELPTGAMPSMPAGASQVSFRPDDAFTGSGACGNVYEFVLYALSDETISPPQTNNQGSVRTFVQGLDTILGTASIRARSSEPEC